MPKGPSATTNGLWRKVTWKASWRPSNPTATPAEPSGGVYVHRGAEGLRELYAHLFANGGGIPLEHCTLTDDGVRCAIEYNCVRWGVTNILSQAGVAVYERGNSGLLGAARIYDDVSPPDVSDTSSVL